jgi:hypothetical protein
VNSFGRRGSSRFAKGSISHVEIPGGNLMSKPTKSQWDFGELFPAEQTRKVLSVSELTAQVKRLLEKQVGDHLGHGRGHESARAIFRPHLFHAQGRGGAVELRAVQPARRWSASRIAGGRAEGFAARRRDGL